MGCITQALTNKEGSLLYPQLDAINSEKADSYYAYFKGDSFKEIFGDYLQNSDDISFEKRTHENGEPKLFLDKSLNKHYFISKDFEKVYYPYERVGLGGILSTSEIKEFTESIALKFFEENVDLDMVTMVFTNKYEKSIITFVDDYIEAVSGRLFESPDFEKQAMGMKLEDSMLYSKEWADGVKAYFETIHIKVEDNEEESIEEQLTETRGEVVRKASFLKSSKNNMLSNIKLYLSVIKDTKENSFGEFSFVPFDDIYSTLNKKLANTVAVPNEDGILEDPYELYLSTIEELTAVKPYLKQLVKKLRDPSITEEFKNQFVSAFNLYRNIFLGSEFIKADNGKVGYTIKNLSETGSRRGNILTEWHHNFIKSESDSKLNNSIEVLKTFTQNYNSEKTHINDQPVFNLHADKARTSLSNIGVTTSPEGFKYYLNGQSAVVAPLEDQKKRLTTLLDRLYTNVVLKYQEEKKRESILSNNIFKEQESIRNLAEANAFFMKESSDASIFTMGKTKWVYSNPSYLDLKIASWKKDPNLLLKHYKSTPYNKNSVYMQYLLGMENNQPFNETLAKERLGKIELGIFNSLQEEGDSINASDNSTLSHTDMLVDYVHKALGQHSGNNKSWQKTALAADKSTEYQINYGIELLKADATYSSGQYSIRRHVIETFYDYFMDEYHRMQKVSKDIRGGAELLPNYHTGPKNGLKSQLFPSLSVNFNKAGEAVLPESLSFALYDSEGHPNLTTLSKDQQDEIKKLIKDAVVTNIRITYDLLLDESLIGFNEKGDIINNSIDNSLMDFYKTGGLGIRAATFKLAGDLFVNSVVSQVEYGKMFTGDLAYYKHMVDYNKRVPATYTDGLYMRLNESEKNFNISVIDSVFIDEPSLEYMKEYLSPEVWQKYSKEHGGGVNSTDAQAWITPDRWEFILRKLGKWTPTHSSVKKKMYQKVPSYNSKELKLVAQPLKGVYFDVKDGRPSFLKYSQAVLVPNLVKGTGLETLLNKMTSASTYGDQIHEVITKDGIKVGFSEPVKTHSDTGEILSDFELKPQVLNNAYWKLQQDLPTKGIKEMPVGTQIQKNVFQGLAHNLETVIDLKGEEKTGSEMINYLNQLTDLLGVRGLKDVSRRLGVDPETKQIYNENALYQSVIKQLSTRKDTPSNLINAMKAGLSPYGIPGGGQIFQNAFSSIINKGIIDIKTQGGGFIQMADYGLTKSEAKDKGIMFTPWFEADKSNRLYAPKLKTNKDGKKTIQPGGIFISGSIIAQYIPDYRKYSTDQLFGKLEPKTGKYIDGVIDREILETIIGYRIPNQGLASNDAFQILGILPEDMGDTVIAYAGITTKTGSDYDIDKMYLMVPNMILSKGKLRYFQPYMKEDGTEVDLKLQPTKVLQNKLIEAYKSILTTPELMDKIMNPIDVPFFENDIINLNPTKDPKDLDNFNAIADIDTKIKFKSSKAGLGVAVNNTMDFVRGTMANLNLDHFIGWGKKNNLGNTKFDHEYSEKLTDREIEEYVDDMTKRMSVTEIKEYIKKLNINSEDYTSDREALIDYYINNLYRVLTSDTLMALTNGFVDVANNPFIVEGNWVSQTNNIGFMLVRAGVHPFKINAFLNQPIIKDYVAYKNNIESKTVKSEQNPLMAFKLKKVADKLGDETVTINDRELSLSTIFKGVSVGFKGVQYVTKPDPSNQEEVAKAQRYEKTKGQFLESLKNKVAKQFKITDLSSTNLSKYPELIQVTDLLKAEFRNYFDIKPVDFRKLSLGRLRKQNIETETEEEVQEAVLNKYLEWVQSAKPLSANVTASRSDVDGKGKDIMSLIISGNSVNKAILSKKLLGFNTKFFRDGQRTTLRTAIDHGITFPHAVMKANPKFFLEATDSVISTYNSVSRFIYDSVLTNEKLASKLSRNYNNYIFSGFPPFNMTNEEKSKLLIDMPNRLKVQKQNNKKNTLIQKLTILEGDLRTKGDLASQRFFIGISNAAKTKSVKDEFTDSWRELLETEPVFAEDLIKYAFIVSGGNKTTTQFFEYIPYEWFNKHQFNTYLKSVGNNTKVIDKTFLDQFFRHNLDDNAIVEERLWKTDDSGKLKGFSTLPDSGLGQGSLIMMNYIPKQIKYALKFKDFVGLNKDELVHKYYIYVDTVNGKPVYARTTKLGYKDTKGNRVPEFNISNSMDNYKNKSMFSDNIISIDNSKISAYLDKLFNKQSSTGVELNSDDIITKKYGFTDNIKNSTDTITIEINKSNKSPNVKPFKLEDVTRDSKKTSYSIVNPVSKEEFSKTGYRINIKDQPDVNLYLTKDTSFYIDQNKELGLVQSKNWIIDELSTGLTYPLKGTTLKGLLKELTFDLNKKIKSSQNVKILKDIGFDFKNPCK